MKSIAGLTSTMLAFVLLFAAACGAKNRSGGGRKAPRGAPHGDATGASDPSTEATGAAATGNGEAAGDATGGGQTGTATGDGETGTVTGETTGSDTDGRTTGGTATTTGSAASTTTTTGGSGTATTTTGGSGTATTTTTGGGTNTTTGTTGTTTGGGTTGTTTGGGNPDDHRLPETAIVKLVARPSAADGCVVTATKTLKDDAPATGDHFFFYEIEPAVGGGNATLRLRANFHGILVESAWIEASSAIVDEAAARLKRGETLAVAKDAACAENAAANAATLKVAKLTLFPEPADGAALNGVRETLELATPRDDGAFAFSAMYGYEGQLSWQLSYETKISDAALAALPDQVQWNVYNRETLGFAGEWTTTSKDSVRGAQLALGERAGGASDAILKRILPRQAQLELIFDAGAGKKRLSLPLGDLCKRLAPEYFIDLTHADKRCFEVKDSDMP